MKIALAAALLVLGLATADPQPAVAADPIVVVQVQSKSWIKDSTFDLDHFAAHCSGVTLVTARTPEAAGLAVLRYSEAKGPGFSMFGVGTPAGFGTNVTLALTLLDARTAKTLITLSATGATPAGLPVERFHSAAIAALHESPAYQLACTVVAAALGSRQAAVALLPWAVLDAQGRAVIDRLSFAPSSETERAYLAVAHRDFRSIKALGEAAIEPLLLMFVNTTEPRNGAGLLSLSDPDNVRALLDALPLLEAANDDAIVDALVDFLSDQGDLQPSSADAGHAAVPVVRGVLRALGQRGDAFTLPLLDEWAAAGGPSSADAANAAAALRKRMAIQ
jgi:hypothetical protein